MEDPSQNLILQFVLLLILTLLNAFFSASEMALVSLNRSRVEQKAEEGDKKFIRLLSVLENPNNFYQRFKLVSPLSVSYRGLAYLPLLGVLLRLGLEILFGLRQQVVLFPLSF